MTKTLKSLRRVKEKGVAVTGITLLGSTLLIILNNSIIPLVILFRFGHLYGLMLISEM